MKQILHIFAKDARRFWPEISLEVALLVALIFFSPRGWTGRTMLTAYTSYSMAAIGGFLPNLLDLLIPISWWLLISRVIHAENLVGDRQFWVTRPYQWKKLLAAKLLFVVTFLYLPLLLTQSTLLAKAGFNPLAYIPGLFYGLLLLTCVLILPFLALAVVTSTFARMTLTLLGALLLYGILGWLSNIPAANHVSMPWFETITFYCFMALCGAAVVLQYATRRTGRARSLLIAFPVLLLVSAFLAPGQPDQALMNRTFPLTMRGTASAIGIAYSPTPEQQPTTMVGQARNEIGIDLPIQISGIDDRSLVETGKVRVAIEAPDGSRWNSPWQSGLVNDTPGNAHAHEHFTLPLQVYMRLKSMPLKVHLDIAFSMAEVSRAVPVILSRSNFSVPGLGICVPDVVPTDPFDQIIGFSCRTALRTPPLTYVRADWEETSACAAAQAIPTSSVVKRAEVGALQSEPARFGISPITLSMVGMSINERYVDGHKAAQSRRGLCPGSLVTFTEYNLVSRGQTSLSIEDFHLPALTNGQLQVIAHP